MFLWKRFIASIWIDSAGKRTLGKKSKNVIWGKAVKRDSKFNRKCRNQNWQSQPQPRPRFWCRHGEFKYLIRTAENLQQDTDHSGACEEPVRGRKSLGSFGALGVLCVLTGSGSLLKTLLRCDAELWEQSSRGRSHIFPGILRKRGQSLVPVTAPCCQPCPHLSLLSPSSCLPWAGVGSPGCPTANSPTASHHR